MSQFNEIDQRWECLSMITYIMQIFHSWEERVEPIIEGKNSIFI